MKRDPADGQTGLRASKPGTGGHSGLGLPFFKFMVFEDPNWDFKTFRFDAKDGLDSDVDFTDAKLGALFNATDPNLTAFKSRGGKLIQYHGWSDPDITPLNSINYYESVAQTMGHGGNHGLRDTREFYRLFMVPGMQHCTGGPSATNFSMVEAAGAMGRTWNRARASDRVAHDQRRSGPHASAVRVSLRGAMEGYRHHG